MARVTRSGVYKQHNDLVKHLRVLHKIKNVVLDCTVCQQSFKDLQKHHQDCSTVEKLAQKSAPSTRSKKTPGSDTAALEEPEHSTQPAAQEPISSETPTGPPVELDQQNPPPRGHRGNSLHPRLDGEGPWCLLTQAPCVGAGLCQ
ncbi:hypothetical protein LAZ67_1008340 [Cordylochernes scorpioides]|uniref:Uncharacterized protein n=1 Tax=Cordylochernes scorpioides TaxID=51811 RepID=A0ABY6K1D8_9ARAC|nr:hypothetical protein LAZ67_1008340 [Cordylochernes scorpioides]